MNEDLSRAVVFERSVLERTATRAEAFAWGTAYFNYRFPLSYYNNSLWADRAGPGRRGGGGRAPGGGGGGGGDPTARRPEGWAAAGDAGQALRGPSRRPDRELLRPLRRWPDGSNRGRVHVRGLPGTRPGELGRSEGARDRPSRGPRSRLPRGGSGQLAEGALPQARRRLARAVAGLGGDGAPRRAGREPEPRIARTRVDARDVVDEHAEVSELRAPQAVPGGRQGRLQPRHGAAQARRRGGSERVDGTGGRGGLGAGRGG